MDDLIAKQKRLEESHSVGSWDRWDYDMDTGVLLFSDAERRARVAAEFQIVGSTGPRDWLWSWGNESLPSSCTQDMLRVRAFGDEHGIDELTQDFLEASDLDALGWEVTAVAAKILGSVGSYRPKGEGQGALFLVLQSIRFVS
jgi:hypothetical protein